jgi:hypothetical protein
MFVISMVAVISNLYVVTVNKYSNNGIKSIGIKR